MRDHVSEAVLGLGSNMGDKVANIDKAVAMLCSTGDIRLKARSRYHRTAPWGVTDQDWFVNACIQVITRLAPRELLERCQEVESCLAACGGGTGGLGRSTSIFSITTASH